MRNVFDQYSQLENRITHAFLTALNEDRLLLENFLRDVIKVKPPIAAKHLTILEQKYPGEEEGTESDFERRGVPDGWIFDGEGWCVLFESKVTARLSSEQLRRHQRTAVGRGFHTVTTVAITARKEADLESDVVVLEWRTIYAWLCKQSVQSQWAVRAATYFEVAEATLIEAGQFVEGTLTMFAGIPFGDDRPYTYLEAKRVLGLALGELRGRKDLQKVLNMNPSLPGRPAITGSKEQRVWDFLSLGPTNGEDAFTRSPHLTLGIHTDAVEAMLTVPHKVNSTMRAKLINLGEQGFRALIERVIGELGDLLVHHPGATPRFRGVQRRYPSQRSKPLIDAIIEFDLRTAVTTDSAPKMQPKWLAAAYGAFVNKEGANYQMQIGVVFPYEHCPELKEPVALDMISRVWLGCKPLADLA